MGWTEGKWVGGFYLDIFNAGMKGGGKGVLGEDWMESWIGIFRTFNFKVLL